MNASAVEVARGSAELVSDALVVFGFTGDLATKKIFPALYAMAKKKTLMVPVIGVVSGSDPPHPIVRACAHTESPRRGHCDRTERLGRAAPMAR